MNTSFYKPLFSVNKDKRIFMMENNETIQNPPTTLATTRYQQTSDPSTQPHSASPPKIKPIFRRSGSIWRCKISSDIPYINKKKPKMLSHISISSLHSKNIGNQGLRNLHKALIDSKRTSSLYFDNPNLNSKQLTYLLSSSNHWRNLSFFVIENRDRMNEELLKALSRLGQCKNLLTFPLPSLSTRQNINKKTFIRLSRQFRELTKLKRLSLEIPFYTISNYRPPRSLTSLSLNFKKKPLSSQQQQKISLFTSKIIQRCNLLEQLSLKFQTEYHIKSSDVKIWAFFFQHPPSSLSKLSLDLSFNPEQQPEVVQTFMETFKPLKHLTSLNLSLDCSFVGNRLSSPLNCIFPALFTSLQYLTQLKTLEFNLINFRLFENHHLQHFASTLQDLKDLQKLVISLPSLESPNEGLVSIAHSVKHLSNLKILDLKLANKVTHKSVDILSKNIAHLHLTSFCLDLGSSAKKPNKPAHGASGTKSSGFGKFFSLWKGKENPPSLPPSLTPLFSSLNNFDLLFTLKLQLSAFDISPEELKHLSLSFKQLKRLSSLSLSFSQFDPMNNFEGLRNLLSCLCDLPKLTHFDMAFEGDVSNQEVGILSSYLASCQSLISLNLRLKKAAQLTDESLYFLLLGIRDLRTLKYLTLLFQKEKPFGEKAVSEFFEGLIVLKHLYYFYFLYSTLSLFQPNNAPLPPNLKS